MPYKTRPYVGLPFIPNLLVQYIVDGATAEIKNAFRRSADVTVKLPPIQAKPSRKLINLGGLLNHGDVVVKQAGGNSETFKNVSNAQEFIDALYGRHASVQLKSAAEPSKPLDQNTPLENYVICLPAVSQMIDDTIWKRTRNMSVPRVVPGAMVRKGDVISSVAGVPILSPVDGKIHFVGPGSSSSIRSDEKERVLGAWETTPSDDPGKRLLDNITLVRIQPALGSTAGNIVEDTFKNVFHYTNNFDRMLKPSLKAYTRDQRLIDAERELLKENVELLRSMKPRFEQTTPGNVPAPPTADR